MKLLTFMLAIGFEAVFLFTAIIFFPPPTIAHEFLSGHFPEALGVFCQSCFEFLQN